MAPASSSAVGRSAAGSGLAPSQRATATTASGSAVRARPLSTAVPHLRQTPSTSSLRAKSAAASSSATAVTGASASTPSTQRQSQPLASAEPPLIKQLPPPDFSAAALTLEPIQVTSTHLQSRLLQIAQSYFNPASSPSEERTFITDLRSASFYARLAFNCNPRSVAARRLLAATLLQGAQIFPFGFTSSRSSPSSFSGGSISRSGAHAAIELIKNGPKETFADVGCARIYATASVALGRLKEAEEALAWSKEGQGRWGVLSKVDADEEEEGQDRIDVPSDPWIGIEKVQECIVLIERGRLSVSGNRDDEARSLLKEARREDPWSWSAWVGLCDLGDGSDSSKTPPFFGQAISLHDPRTLYTKHLQNVLLANGQEKDAVHQAIGAIESRGAEYFTARDVAAEASGKTTEGPSQTIKGAIGQQQAGVRAEEMTRTASKRTSAQAATPSSSVASSTFARPGSRTDVTAAKRMRTMPSSTTAPQKSVASARTVATAGGKASATGPGSVRMTGTLSASRSTNEQARPASVASTSSRGTQGGMDDMLKVSPRRSARTNNAPGQVENVHLPATNPAPSRPRIAEVVTTRRTVAARPGARNLPSATAAAVRAAETDVKRPLAPSATVSLVAPSVNKTFLPLVQLAARRAAREASLWNATDDQISLLTRTLATAYQAVRNGRGRKAIALLRPQGPLTKQDIDGLRKEAFLTATSPTSMQCSDKDKQEPIQVFGGLAENQRNCFEVQCLIARAQHDQGRYHLAEKHFLHARRLSPSSLAHMDIFSLTLFHLQREVQLSQLVADLRLIDPTNAVTYIAAGNAFALQREHSFALQSFQRACASAPGYAYAFTLAGYEACELGQREKSIQLFREANKIDKRHWNAFAGLGQVYLQEDKLQAAAYHYHAALDVHRTNAILWDVYGRVKMAQGSLSEAERAFECALRLDDRSAMSHVKLAECFLRRSSVERQSIVAASYREKAHEHLLKAVHIAPDEAHVHLTLAKSYMERGQGAFATLLHNNRNAANSEHAREPQEVELSELAAIGMSGPGHLLMHEQQQIRAVGRATLPNLYRAEIARHLSTAVDLNPRLARYVKAMGEGARAALRGAAARLSGGMGEYGDATNASLLPDEMTGVTTTDGLVDSMLELEGEDVHEDEMSDQGTEVFNGSTRDNTGEEDAFIESAEVQSGEHELEEGPEEELEEELAEEDDGDHDQDVDPQRQSSLDIHQNIQQLRARARRMERLMQRAQAIPPPPADDELGHRGGSLTHDLSGETSSLLAAGEGQDVSMSF